MMYDDILKSDFCQMNSVFTSQPWQLAFSCLFFNVMNFYMELNHCMVEFYTDLPLWSGTKSE